MKKSHSNLDIRTRAVEAVSSGQTIESVAKALRYNRSTIHRWLQRYKANPVEESLKPKHKSGRPRIWKKKFQDKFIEDISEPASKFGFETDFWTCPRLVQHAKKKYKLKISLSTMWRYLRESGFTYQKPEKRYKEADPVVQESWLKNELPKIKKIAKKYRAILYFEDEANIQLSPILGKTWAIKGQTPSQKVTGNRGSVAAISAISSDGRLIFNLIKGKFRSQNIIKFLSQMLKHHPRRHLVVVMDQATPHVSKVTQEYIDSQKRLHVFYLPSRSPDMNPDEKIWNHLKHQELKSHQATNLKELTQLTKSKLKKISKDPSLVKGIFFRSSIAIHLR